MGIKKPQNALQRALHKKPTVIRSAFTLGVVASRLANMCEGRPKNTISIDTVSKSVNDKNFDYANLQNGNDKRSQSEAAEMECRFSHATQKADTPIYQCVLGDVVKVAWLSGRVKVSKSEQFRTFDAGRVGT